jgi:hypothetical protein
MSQNHDLQSQGGSAYDRTPSPSWPKTPPPSPQSQPIRRFNIKQLMACEIIPADLASTTVFDFPHIVSVHEKDNLAVVKVSFESAQYQTIVTPEQLLQTPGGCRALNRFRSKLWWIDRYGLQRESAPRVPFIHTAEDGTMKFVFGN